MKPLTLEETRLKEEMKHECFWDNIHYKNPEAKKTFNLICHLEDFELQYWELQKESKHLDEVNCKLRKTNEQLKDNWNELKKFIVEEYYMYLPLEASTKSITILINKMKEIEKGSNSNVKD